jgi:hypothetical protein
MPIWHGSLMYAMVCTRPDIAYAVGIVSHFVTNLGEAHFNAVSEFSGISKVLLDHACALEAVIMYSKAIHMHIMLVMQILESLIMVT